MRLESIKTGLFLVLDTFQPGSRIFSLGRTIVIIDNANS